MQLPLLNYLDELLLQIAPNLTAQMNAGGDYYQRMACKYYYLSNEGYKNY